MTLTAKQEAFCQAMANGCNQSDAYRVAYNAGNMKPETVQNNAYKLMTDNEVATRVSELKGALEAKALWSREDSVLALRSIASGGEARPTEIVAAIKELNLMHGFNAPTKVELGGNLIHRIERVIVDPKN